MQPIKPSYGQTRKPKHKKWTMKWAAPKAEWRRRWRCGGSWAAATINLTLHCVKLMLPSRYTVRNEGAATCRRSTCNAGLWAQCTCSPTNRTFSVSVCKNVATEEEHCGLATASGSRSSCSASARVKMGRDDGRYFNCDTLPKIKMRFNS